MKNEWNTMQKWIVAKMELKDSHLSLQTNIQTYKQTNIQTDRSTNDGHL